MKGWGRIVVLNIGLLAAGIIVGFILGRVIRKGNSIYAFWKHFYTNLDNFILLISAFMVISSITLSVVGKLQEFATVTINIFGSVVFSWLLTKKSSKEEFKQEQEELALRSYRHINYIELASNTAYKKIDMYITNNKQLDSEAKLMLSSSMDQIKYIQGGINTCKMDWYDMLSDTEKRHYENNVNLPAEYGTIEVRIPDSSYNQEDA